MKVLVDVPFSALDLRYESDGGVTFEASVIKRLCAQSRIPMLTDADAISAFIVNWYIEHLRAGGERDTVAHSLCIEVLVENDAGQNHSFKPGRA